MRAKTNLFRWIAVLAAMVLLAAACGDDGGDATPDSSDASADEGGADEGGADEGGADGDSADEGGADEGGADEGSTDEGSTDEGSADDSADGTGDEDAGSDDGADVPPPGGPLDCAELSDTLERAGNIGQLDPTGGSGDNLEQEFNQARASLAAIGEAAPEISDAVDEALEGFDAIGAAFAAAGWDTDFSSNPTAALEIAQAMGEADVIGMIGAMSIITDWVGETCS